MTVMFDEIFLFFLPLFLSQKASPYPMKARINLGTSYFKYHSK